jgi:hypothetical protein
LVEGLVEGSAVVARERPADEPVSAVIVEVLRGELGVDVWSTPPVVALSISADEDEDSWITAP